MELIIIPILIKSEQKRFELRKGKFGCYFYDNEIMIDMTLDIVLNRLNINEQIRVKQLKAIRNLEKEIFDLNNKIILLKERILK